LRKSHRFVLVFAVLVLAIDQVTKYLVAANLPLGDTWSPLPGPYPLFQIVHAFNTGAAFGLFKDLSWVFVIVAIGVSGAILVYMRKLGNEQRLIGFALGLMLGGSIGNLLDRVRLGHVIDFIDIGIGSTRWYTSNLADASIVLGVIVLGLAILRDGRRHEASTSGGTEATGVQP
jgi:signal peptidase II